jgi:hypothetical protein
MWDRFVFWNGCRHAPIKLSELPNEAQTHVGAGV